MAFIFFKTFLEENCAVALDSCYLFTKKNVEYGIEHDIAYGACIGPLDVHF